MRFIDAEALENEIVKTMRYVPKDAVLDVACMVNRAPTIEAKPVVHAHWNNDGRCTNCGEHAPFFAWADEWYETKYCHGCGAQMDGTDINVGSKEPISQTHENGVKISVINMEDVPKIIKEE